MGLGGIRPHPLVAFWRRPFNNNNSLILVLDNEGGQDLVKLIQLIAEGDESAFAPLYDATSGLLFGLLLLILDLIN